MPFPLVVMMFFVNISSCFGHLGELGPVGWFLYIICSAYGLIAIGLVTRLDTIMAVSPKLWLCTFFAVMMPFLGLFGFQFVASAGVQFALHKLGEMLLSGGYNTNQFVAFIKVWPYVVIALCLSVSFVRCMGLLVGCNKQKIIQALKNAET